MTDYATFDEWMTGATIYIEFDRYGEYSAHGFVAVSAYSDDDLLRDAVEDLAGGDNDMFEARELINKMVKDGNAWVGAGSLPSDACKNLEDKMREAQKKIIQEMRAVRG